MFVILSPAKNLRNTDHPSVSPSQPRFLEKSDQLIHKLQKQSKNKLKSLMNISDKLAIENHERFQSFESDHHEDNSQPAVYTFNGDVYQGLDIDTFSTKQLEYSQDHLRILSGLYGLLRPLDLIQPYRLEMGTSFSVGRKKNLYEFWNTTLTEKLNEDLLSSGDKVLLNLASNEYWNAIDSSQIELPIVKANFKEYRKGKYMFLSYNAKRARGMMAKYVLQNKIKTIDELKNFDVDDYQFNPDLSDDHQLIFTK